MAAAWAGLAWAGLGCCVLLQSVVAVAAILSATRPITNQHDLDTSDLVIGANIRNHRKLVIDDNKQNTTNSLKYPLTSPTIIFHDLSFN